LYQALSRTVIGQDDALRGITEIWQLQKLGLQRLDRPLGTFLFLGPTGTGKTHLVEQLAQYLHGSAKMMIKINCAEYQHGHEVARLIGSPPGYLGHRETKPKLNTAEMMSVMSAQNPVAIILLDEVDKAHDALWTLFLGVMDKGVLELGDNSKVMFDRSLLFMTSNVGAKEIEHAINPQFGLTPSTGSDIGRLGPTLARKKFTPEFMNRIDRVVTFKPLSADTVDKILDLEIAALQARLTNSTRVPPFRLMYTKEARQVLLSQGTDTHYGARALSRCIDRLVMLPLVNMISASMIESGASIIIGSTDGKELTFSANNQ
jgi:ATP-dependent Clp protease ATP-binding subunit ClpA